ncbi:MAG TPA: hypothetical protein VMV69_09485 [Pirellulales bacterium]|nr:hypothetical protein [Pirellulales bacterium]
MNPRRHLPNTSHAPSLDEIREACARIRARWGEAERRKRAGMSPEVAAVEMRTVTPGVLDGRR